MGNPPTKPSSARKSLLTLVAAACAAMAPTAEDAAIPTVKKIIFKTAKPSANGNIGGALIGITFTKDVPVMATFPVMLGEIEVDGEKQFIVERAGGQPKRNLPTFGQQRFGNNNRVPELHPDFGVVPMVSVRVGEKNDPRGTYLLNQVPSGYRTKFNNDDDDVRTLDDVICEVCKNLDPKDVFRTKETPDVESPLEKEGLVFVRNGTTYISIPVNDITLWMYATPDASGKLTLDPTDDVWGFIEGRGYVNTAAARTDGDRNAQIAFRGGTGTNATRAEYVVKKIWEQVLAKEYGDEKKPFKDTFESFQATPRQTTQRPSGLQTQRPISLPSRPVAMTPTAATPRTEINESDI